MSEVLMTNVFFIITGIAILVASIMFTMVLYQIWRITRVLRRVSEKIEAGAARVAEDAAALKRELTSGKLFGKLIQFALSAGREGFGSFIDNAVSFDTETEDSKKKKRSTKVRHTRKSTARKSSAKKLAKMKITNLD